MIDAAPRRRAPRALRAVIAIVGAGAFGALSAGDAHAYCFTTTCPGQDVCDGDTLPGCIPLYWGGGCPGYSVQVDGSALISAETAETIVDLAFDQWRFVDCAGRRPGLYVWDMGQVACDKIEYNKDAGNANVVVFRDDAWPHVDDTHNIALTTTTFDPDTGELLDADIELNSSTFTFTVDDLSIQYDLLSVLTHEAGHFLGLGHSQLPEATMFAAYDAGTIELRTPDADDVAAICSLYPPDDSVDSSCNPLQRHGFSPDCRDEQTEGSCALRAGASSDSGAASGVSALVALALARAVRARTGRRRRSESPRA